MLNIEPISQALHQGIEDIRWCRENVDGHVHPVDRNLPARGDDYKQQWHQDNFRAVLDQTDHGISARRADGGGRFCAHSIAPCALNWLRTRLV